ncbi:MAG TPA: hypothetical protein P5137_13190 [Candidatus Brocadiia bacterium]|nr:hypothetical protein [Candidatus Brocadiia bacterium]
MGAKLAKFFDLAKAEGGLPTQMRLAMKTGVASAQAATAPDSPDNIAKFQKAYKEITGKDAGIN